MRPMNVCENVPMRIPARSTFRRTDTERKILRPLFIVSLPVVEELREL